MSASPNLWWSSLLLSGTQEIKATIITKRKQGWKYPLIQRLPGNSHYEITFPDVYSMLWNRDLRHRLSLEGFSKPTLLTEDNILLICEITYKLLCVVFNIHEQYTSKIFCTANIFKNLLPSVLGPKHKYPKSAWINRKLKDVMKSKAECPFAGEMLPLHCDVKERCGSAGHSQWTKQWAPAIFLLLPGIELLGQGLGFPKAKQGK